jgi:hypothetical protein
VCRGVDITVCISVNENLRMRYAFGARLDVVGGRSVVEWRRHAARATQLRQARHAAMEVAMAGTGCGRV